MRASLSAMQRGPSEASYRQAVVVAFIAACIVPFAYEVWSYGSYLMRFQGRCTEWMGASFDCSFARYAVPSPLRMPLAFAALEHLVLGAMTFVIVMFIGAGVVRRARRKARKGLRFERSPK